MAKQTPNIDYVTIETYKNFSNGIKQVAIKFPAGTKWVHTGKEHWTIVPKSFYNETEWSDPIEHENVFDKWVVCIIRDIDSHPYFEEFFESAEDMMNQMRLEQRIFAFIKDSSQLCGLLRFDKMKDLVGPATYIQLVSRGIINEPKYGIYTDPKTRPTQPDCFGKGKWIEVSPDKAPNIWTELYSWVLDKLVFIDRPCPLMLSCKQAHEILHTQLESCCPTDAEKYDLSTLDVSVIRALITIFTNQFF